MVMTPIKRLMMTIAVMIVKKIKNTVANNGLCRVSGRLAGVWVVGIIVLLYTQRAPIMYTALVRYIH